MYFYGGEIVQIKDESQDDHQDLPLDLSVKKQHDDTKNFNIRENIKDNPVDVRPFKAYQRNPLSIMSMLPINVAENETETMEEKYQKFRAISLAKLKPRGSTNQNMRRVNNWNQNEDPVYREKREKNNLAAKRSRDARKMREDELTIRVAFLEAELIKTKTLSDQDKVILEKIRSRIQEKKNLISQQNERLEQLRQFYYHEVNNFKSR